MTKEQQERWESIIRAVKYGLANGKHNMIVDLDILAAVDEELQQQAKELHLRRALDESV